MATENGVQDIINGSKLIAEYLGWQYIPFNDLQGFSKAGWFEVKENQRMMLAKYDGWVKVDNKAVRFVCRKHSELRFYNSFDAIIPVIEKIEKENSVSFYLYNGGCKRGLLQKEFSFDENLTWIQNTFNAVVKYLENEKFNNRL